MIIEQTWIIYSMYKAGEVSVNRACCEQLPNPTHLVGVRLFQAQDQQVTTRTPRIVTECLLTRSMLIKMYVMIFTVDFIQELS